MAGRASIVGAAATHVGNVRDHNEDAHFLDADLGLFLVCVGAFSLDAIRRITAWQPINRADWLADVLYLPEVLYCIGLIVVMLGGPGPWSLDALIAARFALR